MLSDWLALCSNVIEQDLSCRKGDFLFISHWDRTTGEFSGSSATSIKSTPTMRGSKISWTWPPYAKRSSTVAGEVFPSKTLGDYSLSRCFSPPSVSPLILWHKSFGSKPGLSWTSGNNAAPWFFFYDSLIDVETTKRVSRPQRFKIFATSVFVKININS